MSLTSFKVSRDNEELGEYKTFSEAEARFDEVSASMPAIMPSPYSGPRFYITGPCESMTSESSKEIGVLMVKPITQFHGDIHTAYKYIRQ